MSHPRRFRPLSILAALFLLMPQIIGAAAVPQAPAGVRSASTRAATTAARPAAQARPGHNLRSNDGGEEEEEQDLPLERDDAFYFKRIAGDQPLTVPEAGVFRAQAAAAVGALKLRPQAVGPTAYGGGWTPLGPDPIVQVSRGPGIPLIGVAGRIGALAVRSTAPYTIYLGGAQGGVWVSSTLTLGWTPKTDQQSTLSTGAIALAPSNENIVYVGTGEGELSGDSYFGVGVLRSTDAGNTFTKVSGNTFNQVSISNIVVDPTDPNHVWVSTLRGRGGSRRVTPPSPTPYGIYESTNGGATWTPQVTTTNPSKGATSLVIDPQYNGTTNRTMYATWWTQGISKTVDGGATWTSIMNGLPSGADYTAVATRFSLGISHPSGPNATLYTGFEYVDSGGNYQPSTIWKSTDNGASWAQTNTNVVGGYCGDAPNNTQCTYDNEIGVDPNDPNIVFALGLFDYSSGTGGIYRSMDGGASWIDLGNALHPDFHAIAFNKSQPGYVVIGNDGGVWSSGSYGGRLAPSAPIDATTWDNLNGVVDQATGAAQGYGLQITQFTSVQQHPTNNRVYGGTQDNGTLRKVNTATSSRWFDFASGDGGQVLVDPYDPNFVYGTHFGISPYRYTDGMSSFYFEGNKTFILSGIDPTDRAEFYIPFAMDPEYTNRLYLGTFRLYRTDNRGDLWQPISPDLTTGCAGTAPNGARGCFVSAIRANAGSPAVYVGTDDGLVQMTTDATVASPVWTNLTKAPLPNRPVADIAVDRSNYRVAYVAYNGYNAATPGAPGHLFKTVDGGATWTNVSGDLPDAPVSSIIVDPASPNTLYAGTDVGPLVSTNGGTNWTPLGTGFPIVAIWQMNLNPFNGRLVAATHGRGAWSIVDSAPKPSLQVRKLDAGVPVGPNSQLNYTITVRNTGNLTATNVTITDPVPTNTTFVAAGSGGSEAGGTVTWSGLNVPMATAAPGTGALVPGTAVVTLTVQIAGTVNTGDTITDDGISVTSAEAAPISGSPLVTTIAPANAVTLTPPSQTGGAHTGSVVTYTLSVQNLGYSTDNFALSATGNQWPTTIWDAGFTTQIAQLGPVSPGGSASFGVKVSVPVSATNGISDTATIVAASVGNPAVTASATVTTIAVTKDVLLVDNDNDSPDVASYYETALSSNGYTYNYWDLTANPDLPLSYMKAHKAIVWFTGGAYPEPFTPYGDELSAYLDNGGRLFMSSFDGLDQSGGVTAFVHDYLHIDWNDPTDNDKDTATFTATAVLTNSVTGSLGALPVNGGAAPFNYCDCNDLLSLIGPAVPAFTSSHGVDALTVTDASAVTGKTYKVMFLAFPFEAMGTAADRADLMNRALTYFGTAHTGKIYLPLVAK